ncbi:hypothetical protein D3C71_1789120 [compost metagenome]
MLIGLRTQTRDLLQLLPSRELTVLFTIFNDIFSNRTVNASHIREQGRRCRIYIHAHMVNRRFYDSLKTLFQMLL